MKLEEYIIENEKSNIIFDFDDTILSMDKGSFSDWEEMKKIVAKYNSELINEFEDEPYSMYKLTNKAIMLYGEDVKIEAIEFLNKFELELVDTGKRNDEVIEFIENNFEKYTFSIWSSNTLAMLSYVLDKYNLRKCFKVIIGRDSVDLAKPFPDGFYKIASIPGVVRKNYLMVGDSSSDEGGALNAGIDFFKIEKDEVDWK